MRRRDEHQTCGCRVALSDAATALVQTGKYSTWTSADTVAEAARRLGVEVAPDWAGRPSLALPDARRIPGELDRMQAEAQAEAAAQQRANDATRAALAGGARLTAGSRHQGTPHVPER